MGNRQRDITGFGESRNGQQHTEVWATAILKET